MWAYESVFYQIYTLFACGAPFENDHIETKRLSKIDKFIPHIKSLGTKAILFNPIFESSTHGYDTINYRKIDCRLGTNADFAKLVKKCHKNGIKVVVDGVFNHVGRDFFAFEDVKKNKWNSQYKDWFNINFDGNSSYNDGFYYEGWEGHFELVKLNLSNENVINYLLETVSFWIDEFDIDGIRLDVAYLLDRNFLKRLRTHTAGKKNDFFLMGEMIGGDYRQIVANDMCHSATNYECYKGLYSSMNSYNLFEITHSLMRQFGPEDWTLYKNMHLLSFVENHDVSRIYTSLENKNHIKAVYALMFSMPGIPCIYYGGEAELPGDKKDGDMALRPDLGTIKNNEFTDYIKKLISIHNEKNAFYYGDFKSLFLNNKQCIWQRQTGDMRLVTICNIEDAPCTIYYNLGKERATDLISEEEISFEGGKIDIPAYGVYIFDLS